MADFMHDRQYLHKGDIAVVNCDYQCNVQVMTDINFEAYRSGRRYDYYGGFYSRLPARIVIPSTGWWNTVLDLGGGSANVRYGFSYVKQ